MSLNGSKSIEEIGLLNFDMLFLGLTSFQSSMGFGCGSDDEAALKRALQEILRGSGRHHSLD